MSIAQQEHPLHTQSAKPDVSEELATLTNPEQLVRGCRVCSDRAYLQALQQAVGWTIGGYDTRPTSELAAQKNLDRVRILLGYRQVHPATVPPRIRMYDYLCDTLFKLPMKPVAMAGDLAGMQFMDEDGVVHDADWIEVDWEAFGRGRSLEPVLACNQYPYRLPVVIPGAHWMMRKAQHWIVWWFHYPWDPQPEPSDHEIDVLLRCKLRELAAEEGFESVDFIWYRNPAMSVPDMFHVQVFWIVPSRTDLNQSILGASIQESALSANDTQAVENATLANCIERLHD